ncbi:MAG TPA: hypothetical protein VFA30_01395 [Gaiellaceae bacterium]|nr:hypothetical protein [Gaiellaceae bacterium]
MNHLIGLVLGTEEDWPAAFEALAARVGAFEWRGERHVLEVERVYNEPFDLRYRPRYDLVVDRVGWWYLLPREWLKKIALMDDVYLLNNPFTFQSMEKHSAYCAMMRLGLKVPETWLIPHKQPPWNERFPTTAARYNRAFDLEEIGSYVGYPLYLKPFDGGAWRGVTRASSPEELRRRYDESGQQLMHVQSAVDPFDVFARSLSIGAETKVMWFDPDRPMFDRYQVRHGFLTADQGFEVETISKVVNAFFRWEFNSCESIVREGEIFPIDYANASPDVALTSLHFYFPWAMLALVRWCAFCLAEGRQIRIDVDPRPWFEIADREDLSYEEKLARYRTLADEYFEADAYAEFCAGPLAHVEDAAREWFSGDEFDRLLVATVQSTFPPHEHERFVEHYRGLLALRA